MVGAGGVLLQAFRYLRDVRELEAGETPEQKPELSFRWHRKEHLYSRYKGR